METLITGPIKRKNNSKEYNRKYWHIMKANKGKWTCPICNVEIDFMGKTKHINGLKHKSKIDPEFKRNHDLDLLNKRVEKLKARLDNPKNEKSKNYLTKELNKAQTKIKELIPEQEQE